MRNRYPHYTCGSCSVHLAFAAGDISLETAESNHCCSCPLYQKGIYQITTTFYIYRNIFIEAKETPNTYDHFSYRIVNREEWYPDIDSVCDAIDKEITNG